ncbi:MAG: Uma2 family endonuclease [Eubacteriaceae bacterium]|nr:Uma2 family endonuclease [Eubacteriaceae bacterium]
MADQQYTDYEIINGITQPKLTPYWQIKAIASELHGQLWLYLQGKPYRVIESYALSLEIDSADVYKPDVYVVSTPSYDAQSSKFTGLPDLIVEIITPEDGIICYTDKFMAYTEARVPEYWIINTYTKTVQTYILNGERYDTRLYFENDTALVESLNGCKINLQKIFSADLF